LPKECRGVSRAPRRDCCSALRGLRYAALLAAVTVAQLLSGPSAAVHAAILEVGPTPGPAGLPDGRVYEQVSPAAKNGNQAAPPVAGGHAYGVASPDGSRILYSSTGPIGEATSGVDNFSISTRSPSGWRTRAALPQPPPAPRDPISSGDPVWLLPSSDRSSVAFTARNPFTLSTIDFANPNFSFASTYLSSEGGPALWLGHPTVEAPVPALEEVESPSNLVLAGAAGDLSSVYYEYYGTLVPEDAPRRAAVEGNNNQAWGLYEWRGDRLKAANLLPPPSGTEDPDGAVAAAVGVQTLGALPSDFDNQVSRSGNTALFVSPNPEAGSGRPPQLYARVDGSRTVLVSRSELTHSESLNGADAITGLSQSHIPSYAFGSPDGSHVFFTSQEQLTSDAPADSSFKGYQFNLTSETMSYLPGVTAPILAASEDGSTLVFDDNHSSEEQLAVWSGGHVTDIAPLPPPSEEQLYVAPVTLAAGGTVVVFQTDSPIPGFNNGGGYGEVYRYDLITNGLSCVSCPPEGQSPEGTANLSNDDLPHATLLTADSRGVSEDGSEIFFDTPDALVKGDTNERRDVYEWHVGRISLISSGTGTADSVFLDNSASGTDVFFATRDDLSGTDTDGSYDVYDARVGGGFRSSAPSSSQSGAGRPPQATPSLASTALLGAGEQVPTLALTHPGIAKPTVTRAQKLAKSLKACRRKRGRSRRVCEARARQRYGKHRARSRG